MHAALRMAALGHRKTEVTGKQAEFMMRGFFQANPDALVQGGETFFRPGIRGEEAFAVPAYFICREGNGGGKPVQLSGKAKPGVPVFPPAKGRPHIHGLFRIRNQAGKLLRQGHALPHAFLLIRPVQGNGQGGEGNKAASAVHGLQNGLPLGGLYPASAKRIFQGIRISHDGIE
jgi:hypothetical protein